MKKIIFIALDFPDVSKSSHLYSDLMHEFRNRGHKVFVIAPALEQKNSELSNESGIQVLRVPTMKLFGTGKITKGISNLLLPFQFKRALKKHKVALDFDLIIMPTPPITLIDVGLWLKKQTKANLYLILRDIFPQNAVDLKMMKPSGIIYNYFRGKEIELYKGSDSIGCMSQANIDYVRDHNPYLDAAKLHLLPNWEKVHEVSTSESEEDKIRTKFNLKNKFVVIFGGNLGLPQKMENVIDLARECVAYEDIVFFLVGRGTQKNKISAMISDLKLSNVILKDGLPRYDYNNILNIADVGLISLSEDFTIPNFPSKVTSYFSLHKPVLASIDLSTDFGVMLEENKCGLWSEAGDTKAFKNNLIRLYKDEKLRSEFGKNGYNYLINNLLPEHAYEIVISHI